MCKFLVLVLVCCGTISMALAQKQITISRFQGETITGLDVSGAFEIRIRQGKETGVTLSIPETYEKHLVFVNQGGKLKIGFEGRIKDHSRDDRFMAEIVCSSLEEIELSGACKLDGNGDFTAQKFKLDLSGAAKVNLYGTISVVSMAKIDVSGASQTMANFTTSDLDIECSGASNLSLSGSATNSKIDVSGASNVNMDGFLLKNLSLEASGASKVQVKVAESFIVEASGASRVIYSGDPKITPSVSGAASLQKK